MPFIEFQNISPNLLVIEPSYLLEFMSNSIMNHDSRTKSRVFPNTLRKTIFTVEALTRISWEFIFAVSEKLVLLAIAFAKTNTCKSVTHRNFSALFPLYGLKGA